MAGCKMAIVGNIKNTSEFNSDDSSKYKSLTETGID